MTSPRKSTSDSQLSLIDQDLPQPVSKSTEAAPRKASQPQKGITKPDEGKGRGKNPLAGRQPALPGIAVRGRPRLRVKRSASERAAESRRQREAAGVRRVELMLTPGTLVALDALVRDSGSTRTDVIARLIENSFRRRRAATGRRRE